MYGRRVQIGVASGFAARQSPGETEVSVPIARTAFEAGSADVAWDVVRRLYTRCRPRSRSAATTLTAESWSTPSLSLDTVRIPAPAEATAEGHDQLTLAWLLGGAVDLEFEHGDRLTCRPGDCFLTVPKTGFWFAFERLDVLTVRLPLDVVDRVAVELTGLERGALRFTSARPLSPAHVPLWRATASLVRDHLCQPAGLAWHPLVHRELTSLVADVALSVYPSTAAPRDYVPGPGFVHPAAVRRAVSYIDAHASLPISLTDIAESCGTSPRALRAAFRRHLGTTPTGYLRRVRLDGAHHDLLHADPATESVSAIGARWGFASPDRFTTAYLAQYGCLPYDTYDA
jgi:AraC-like DNA-binding protein